MVLCIKHVSTGHAFTHVFLFKKLGLGLWPLLASFHTSVQCFGESKLPWLSCTDCGCCSYYKRRLLRIVPAYYSAIALIYVLVLPLQRLPWVSPEAKCATAAISQEPTMLCSKPCEQGHNIRLLSCGLLMGS